MFELIVGVILFIAGVIISLGNKEAKKAKVKVASFLLLVIGCISVVSSFVRTVPTGSTGIVVTFGKVQPYTYEAGVHFTVPWNDVINMDNRVQKQTIEMGSFSSDIQEVNLSYTINYQINKQNAQEIYKTIGVDYFDVVVLPKVQETVKAVIARYNAESLVETRGKLSEQIEETLVDALAAYNIEVVSTSLENIDFTDTFTTAVEAKQVAEQNKLKAQIEQEQAVIEAEAEAQKKVIAAQAEADANLIAAQNDVEVQKLAADAAEYAGEKQAAVNNRIAGSITQELNQYYMIEAWKNGGSQMPTTILGDGNISTMLNLSE